MESLINELKSVLKKELNIYNMLFDLTNNKKDIIISAQIKELDKITQVEQNLILKLGKLENQRQDIIEKLGNDLNIKENITVTNVLSHINKSDSKEIETLKGDLLKIIDNIKVKNDLNNMLIKDSLDYISFNLNMLTDSSQDSTYSKGAGESKTKQSKSLFDVKI